MTFKEKLIKIRDIILDKEDDVELEDHEVGEGEFYKLHYVNYHRINGGPGHGVIDWPLKPFRLPEGMKREDAFKVLSYLTDFIESNLDVGEATFKSVKALDEALDIERFGFRRVDTVKNRVLPISLYTVSGRLDAFKRSKYYNTYFEWYTEGVTRDEVVSIYDNLGLPFYDLVIKNDSVGHPYYGSTDSVETDKKPPVKKMND